MQQDLLFLFRSQGQIGVGEGKSGEHPFKGPQGIGDGIGLAKRGRNCVC